MLAKICCISHLRTSVLLTLLTHQCQEHRWLRVGKDTSYPKGCMQSTIRGVCAEMTSFTLPLFRVSTFQVRHRSAESTVISSRINGQFNRLFSFFGRKPNSQNRREFISLNLNVDTVGHLMESVFFENRGFLFPKNLISHVEFLFYMFLLITIIVS